MLPHHQWPKNNTDIARYQWPKNNTDIAHY
jgi:hypothetical protein